MTLMQLIYSYVINIKPTKCMPFEQSNHVLGASSTKIYLCRFSCHVRNLHEKFDELVKLLRSDVLYSK